MGGVGKRWDGRLLERDSTLADLAAMAAAAASGNGALIVLRAAAGLGKSRLLAELATSGAVSKMSVLAARGAELERDFSFGVARQLFDPLVANAAAARQRRIFSGAAKLAKPLFGAGGQHPDPTGFVTLNALWWLLSNLALDEPVVLLVDDVHWADAPSVRWLSFLALRIAEVPALVIAAGRSDEPEESPDWPGLAAVATHLIDLRPLSPSATETLLGDWLKVPASPAFSAAAHAATGGNPFFANELARELVRRGIQPKREEAASLARVAPDTIAAQVLARLGREPESVQRLARAVSVLGDGVPLGRAAQLAELAEPEANARAVRLADLGILRREDRMGFVHPIVREAVYAGIVPFLRGGWHARAAAILHAHREPAERQAAHLLQTEPQADEDVVRCLRAAAAAALSHGTPAAAVDYLRRAVSEPPPDGDLADVLVDLGEALLLLGDLSAADYLRDAVNAGDPAAAARAAPALVRSLMITGDVDAAIAVADARRRPGDASVRLTVEAELIGAAALAGAETWARLSDRLRSLAETASNAGDAGRPLLAFLAYDEVRRGGSYATAGRYALAAVEGDVLVKRGADYPPFLFAMWSLVRSGHQARALSLLERAVATARARGSLLGFGFASCYRGMAFVGMSDLDSAEAELRLALAAGRDNGWTILEWQALGMYLLALAERGDHELGQAELERSGAEGELPRVPLATGLLVGRANLRYAQGRWQDAYDDFVECGRSEGPYSERSQSVWWRSDAAMALAHLGRNAEAQQLAEAELQIQQQWGDPISLGRAWHAQGLARGEHGIPDLERGAAVLAGAWDAGMAACLVDLGAALRRAKRRSDARPPLRRALDIAERIGSRRYADAARVELAASGARTRSVIRTGLDSLTPSELRIARLAAEGRSNPEIAQHLFVTRKTVETHLGHVYLKLGLDRREQLATVLVG